MDNAVWTAAEPVQNVSANDCTDPLALTSARPSQSANVVFDSPRVIANNSFANFRDPHNSGIAFTFSIRSATSSDRFSTRRTNSNDN